MKAIPDPGPGLGNIHLSTAQRASQYMLDAYTDNEARQLGYQDMETAEVVKSISTVEGNIKAFGAIVKMLADFRYGSGEQPSVDDKANIYLWKDVDFVAIWHGYRYGVRDVSPDGQGFTLDDFQNRGLSLSQLVEVAKGPGARESIEGSYIYLRYYLQRRN